MGHSNGPSRYYTHLAAAFVRGRLGLGASGEDDDLIRRGLAEGLRIHKFKRTSLARVKKVVGFLRGIRPDSLLDVGSGRGVFLWAFLDAFPSVPVMAIDVSKQRIDDVLAVRAGGIDNLDGRVMDVRRLDFADSSFDSVAALETLEHLEGPERACAQIVRVARRFVIVSVPSRPDNNPQHIHLFDGTGLSTMLKDAGARRVDMDYVLNHMIAVAKV